MLPATPTFPRFAETDSTSANIRLSSVAGRETLPPFAPIFLHAQPGIGDFVDQIIVDRSAALSPALRQRIAELANLESNWDGEGAKSVKSHVLADVIEAINRLECRTIDFREPFLAPTFDGFVQLEWHDTKRSLEIEAVSQGWSLAGTMIGNDGNRLYFTADSGRSDFDRLIRFYEWYLGAEFLWPSS